MEHYEVTLQAAVTPRQGELIIPFRETVIRKLERKVEEERVPAGIRSRYAFLRSPLYYRLR